ncbi:hypothetical protein Bca52824_078651 [Brassica carinata]|uniref:Uncharacterized protein n=1 Tax=Brassica carinata TaxID=52824 RepID=A0A8X7PXT9_BRACI|nr:hypothetical protein Bca52824_078651 [Brassica carinata]
MPSTSTLGIQDGVYGAMMVFTYVNGRSADSADVPGLILATSFGASVYDQKKRQARESSCSNGRRTSGRSSGGIGR